MKAMTKRKARRILPVLLLLMTPALLRAQDAPATPEAPQKGTGQVPPGVTLSPQMPGGEAPRPFQFPRAFTKTLPNGLRVFVIPGGREPAITIRLVLTTAGTVNNPQGKVGVAAMTANLLTQGTTRRSAQQIAQAVDFVGGSLSANVDSDATYVTAAVVKKDLELAMDLLSDVVLHPALQKEELERRREQLLSNLNIQYADADYLAGVVFSRVVYGDHPYGLPEEGTPESARRLEREDLIEFHDARYVPNQALLAFAGDITPEAAFSLAEKYLGGWAKKEVSNSAPAGLRPLSGLRIVLVDKPDAVQTQIRVGRLGIARNDPDYIPLYVTNRIFGGGFNSRFNTRVRQQKGLTYGAFSRFETRLRSGSFVASTFTKTETTVEATKLVVELIAEMAKGDIAREELQFAHDYLVGVFPIQSETPAQVAGRVLSVAQYELPADFNDTYRQRILAVGPEQVKAMAVRFFDTANLAIVLAGNVNAFREGIKKEFPHAQVDEIAATELDLLAPNLRRSKPVASAPDPEKLERGKAILLAAVEAAGGAAIGKVAGFEANASGHVTTAQGEIPVELKIQVVYPGRIRVDSKLPFGTYIQAYDGKTGWFSSPQGVRAVPPEFNSEFERGIVLGGTLGIYRLAQAGKFEAQSLGEEEVQGRKAQVLEWNGPSGPVKLYVDPATHLVIAARYTSQGPQGSYETLQVWDDFRAVEGVQYPFHAITYRGGAKYNENTIQSIKLNTDLDASIFTMPQ